MKMLPLVLAACVLSATAWADITSGAAADAANRATDRPSLTSIIEKANHEAASGVGTAGDAESTKLLRDHLTQEQRAERAAAHAGPGGTRLPERGTA